MVGGGRARFIEATPGAIATVGQRRSRMQQRLYAQLRTWSGEDVDTLASLLGRLSTEVVEPSSDSDSPTGD